MPVDRDKAIAEIKAAINHKPTAGGSGTPAAAEYVTLARATIARYAPRESVHRETSDKISLAQGSAAWNVARGVLCALLVEYEQGRTATTYEELVHAATMTDFLDQAEHMAQAPAGMVAACAVAGAVLEAHLRDLSTKHGLGVTKDTGERRNFENLLNQLVGAKVVSASEKKVLTTVGDARNDADHGDFDKVQAREVKWLLGTIAEIRAFIARHPA